MLKNKENNSRTKSNKRMTSTNKSSSKNFLQHVKNTTSPEVTRKLHYQTTQESPRRLNIINEFERLSLDCRERTNDLLKKNAD